MPTFRFEKGRFRTIPDDFAIETAIPERGRQIDLPQGTPQIGSCIWCKCLSGSCASCPTQLVRNQAQVERTNVSHLPLRNAL